MPATVELQNLYFAYDTEKTILNGINLSVKRGEKLGIIGPMGAGKSTLLLHLNGLLKGQGTVKIDGIELTKKNLTDMRKKVGLVFQNPDDQLFNLTVEEDIAFGPINFGYNTEEVKKMVSFAIEKMNLQGFEKMVPHHLSVGERKRVALATVIALRPDVIAFDEPFASLDLSMIKQLIELINSLDSTLIMISHSIFPLVACCDTIAIMNKGIITAKGPAKDILKNDNLMQDNGLDLSFYKEISKLIFS